MKENERLDNILFLRLDDILLSDRATTPPSAVAVAVMGLVLPKAGLAGGAKGVSPLARRNLPLARTG